MTSWLSTESAHAALLDELVKIGATANKTESNRERVLRALKTIGLAAAGSGLGLAAFEAAKTHPKVNKFLFAKKPVSNKMLWAARLGIPTLTTLGIILGSRYRQKVDEGLSPKPAPDVSRTQRDTRNPRA